MRRRLAPICRALSLLAAATALVGCQSGITAAHRVIEGQAIERTLAFPEAPLSQRFDMPREQQPGEENELPANREVGRE